MTPSDLSGEVKGPMEFYKAMQHIVQKIPTVEAPKRHFLPDTQLPVTIRNFWLRGGGIGDRICTFPALLYVLKTRPYWWGRVWVAPALVEFAENIIGQCGNPNWLVRDIRTENIWQDPRYESDTQVSGRGMGKTPDGARIVHAGATGAGGHLVQMGFVDHTGRYNAPEGADYLPEIDFQGWPDPFFNPYLGVKAGNCVVFTTGGVTPARSVPGKYWNPLINYVLSAGLTPVFIGKSEINDNELKLKVTFEEGCDYHKGIDLRDKTTIMEAAWIMENAAAVVGLDNGMLFLAACTKANIICAYNVVDPSDRVPKRRQGTWQTIALTEDELACTGCQTHMQGIAPPHNFRDCLYGHKRCIDLLFAENGIRFKEALARVLA